NAFPAGLAAPGASARVSISITVFGLGPSTSRSRRKVKKCWWLMASTFGATRWPYRSSMPAAPPAPTHSPNPLPSLMPVPRPRSRLAFREAGDQRLPFGGPGRVENPVEDIVVVAACGREGDPQPASPPRFRAVRLLVVVPPEEAAVALVERERVPLEIGVARV